MPTWLLDLLRCPQCAAVFELDDGRLRCAEGHTYPIRDDVPRFVPDDSYASNFSLEWNRHRTTQLDTRHGRRSEDALSSKTGLSRADVEGKLVLDVGCGMGRFADVASRWGGRVVGFDLSYAVDAAQANLGGRENVAIAQADVFRLPFAPQSFDIVYSIGVLHHTPDCAAAFRSLVPLVKPGGVLAVWVYEVNALNQFSDVYRKLTTRMPKSWLYGLSCVAVPLYYIHRIPVIGWLSVMVLPTSMDHEPQWRVHSWMQVG
jgi:2-polyprenyl-3-methyl-5-hydroxy-6-metoxy-1,4-benzoquinol methylase